MASAAAGRLCQEKMVVAAVVAVGLLAYTAPSQAQVKVKIQVYLPANSGVDARLAGIDDCIYPQTIFCQTWDIVKDQAANMTGQSSVPNGQRTWIPASSADVDLPLRPPAFVNAKYPKLLKLDQQIEGYVEAREILALSSRLFERALIRYPPAYQGNYKWVTINIQLPKTSYVCDIPYVVAAPVACPSGNSHIIPSSISINIPLPNSTLTDPKLPDKVFYVQQQMALYQQAEDILALSEYEYYLNDGVTAPSKPVKVTIP